MELKEESLIDLTKYPIHENNSVREKLINTVRKELDSQHYSFTCTIWKKLYLNKNVFLPSIIKDISSLLNGGISGGIVLTGGILNLPFVASTPSLLT